MIAVCSSRPLRLPHLLESSEPKHTLPPFSFEITTRTINRKTGRTDRNSKQTVCKNVPKILFIQLAVVAKVRPTTNAQVPLILIHPKFPLTNYKKQLPCKKHNKTPLFSWHPPQESSPHPDSKPFGLVSYKRHNKNFITSGRATKNPL